MIRPSSSTAPAATSCHRHQRRWRVTDRFPRRLTQWGVAPRTVRPNGFDFVWSS
jgi:hypothetical protein